MPKYRRRTHEVTAEQFTSETLSTQPPELSGGPERLVCSLKGVAQTGSLWQLNGAGEPLKFSDYIITRQDGSQFVLSAGDFQAKYEGSRKEPHGSI